MNADLVVVFPSILLFSLSFGLTAASLWLAGKMAPWFLRESFEPPTMRSYFFDPAADMDLNRGRVVTILIAMAIMLAVLLVMAVCVKFGGVPLI